jgi:hypothetical protein
LIVENSMSMAVYMVYNLYTTLYIIYDIIMTHFLILFFFVPLSLFICLHLVGYQLTISFSAL